MENQELVLRSEALLCDESTLSPEKEQAYISEITKLTEKNSSLEEENADLKQQLAFLKKALYGQKSEKTQVIMEDDGQLSLFNDAEENTEDKIIEKADKITVVTHERKKHSTHKDSFENLEIEEVIHEAEDKVCPECGSEMEVIGKEFVRDELVYVPARMFVRKHYVETTRCVSCGIDESRDNENDKDIPKQVFGKAIAPAALIPGSFCSPELLAHILYSKYVQAIPLYRQEKDYAACGAKISRQTMSNWVIWAAINKAKPVFDIMKEKLLTQSVIHADETVVQVLHEPNKKAKTDSRMWVYCTDSSADRYIALFEYSPTRNGDNAVRFLGEYSGYLVCDGYDGYNKLQKVTRCGCWAHARRKFVEALPTDKELVSTSMAAKGVNLINEMYAIERSFDGLDPEEKHEQRQEQLKPALDVFFAWLETVKASSGTKLSKAISYALNEKKYLYRFLESPYISIDNNRAENAIRPFVVGRKNWLFSNTQNGARASALIYSLAVTACANGLNVEDYFFRLLTSDEPVMPWNE
ncbi:MAG: IS66 family transposase [Porcipelethomonas sp.]